MPCRWYLAGKIIFSKNTRKQIEDADHQSQKVLADAQLSAETLKKEKLLEAKERFVQLKAEHDKEVLERNRKLGRVRTPDKAKEQGINQRMDSLDKQVKENEAIKENLNRQIEVVNHKRTELEKHQEEHIRRLEKIAGPDGRRGQNPADRKPEEEAQTQALALQQEIIDDARQKANKEARKIIIQSIQRTAAEQAIENSITVFNLESDEIKGQIIGREGRNIRAWKQLPVWTSSWTIPRKPSCCLLLIRYAGKLPGFPFSGWWRTVVSILPVSRKWWKKHADRSRNRCGNRRKNGNRTGYPRTA